MERPVQKVVGQPAETSGPGFCLCQAEIGDVMSAVHRQSLNAAAAARRISSGEVDWVFHDRLSDAWAADGHAPWNVELRGESR